MSSATTKPIQFPNEQGLEFTPLSIRQHRIKALDANSSYRSALRHKLAARLFGRKAFVASQVVFPSRRGLRAS